VDLDLWICICGFGFVDLDLWIWICGFGFGFVDLGLWIWVCGFGFVDLDICGFGFVDFLPRVQYLVLSHEGNELWEFGARARALQSKPFTLIS